MDADDFPDYILSFLFLRYFSDNYGTAAQDPHNAFPRNLGLQPLP